MPQDAALPRTKSPPRSPRAYDRYLQKREVILDAATLLLNKHGLKGATLLQVSQQIGLTTTSVTHYFRRKEDLAAAVFERTLLRLIAMAEAAAREPDPPARLSALVRQHLQLQAEVIEGRTRQLAVLSDIRTLNDDAGKPLGLLYARLLDEMKGCIVGDPARRSDPVVTARVNVLAEILFWMPAWIGRYSPGDYRRLHARLTDILMHGLAAGPQAAWAPAVLPPPASDADDPNRATFLRAATRLVNEVGYRGASVERIVASLQVTKGSFYYHHDAKDDLVLECFRQSYRRVSNVLRRSEAAGPSEWVRLSSAIQALLTLQFASDWPLLRTTALQVLPTDLRREAMQRSDRIALRVAGVLSDCVAEGTLRPVDTAVASQVVMAMLNVAYDLRAWAAARPLETAIDLYASTIATGLLDPPERPGP